MHSANQRKPIEQMTVEEMTQEIVEYNKTVYNPEKKFAFISYAHRDRALVYPRVLEWMRQGYNIYIDLDFERHSSAEHWVDLMRDRICDRDCVHFVAFRSKHAAFSYATLLELLTLSSKQVQQYHVNNEISVDIIEMEPVTDMLELDSPGVDEMEYRQDFQGMKEQMGQKFLGNNLRERQAMQEGLNDLISNMSPEDLNIYGSGERLMEILDDRYCHGARNFYPQVALYAKLWERSCNLNGNKKSLHSPMGERFDNQKVYRHFQTESSHGTPISRVSAPSTEQPHPSASIPSAAQSQSLAQSQPVAVQSAPFQPITVELPQGGAIHLTIGQIRTMFEQLDFCIQVGKLRREVLSMRTRGALDTGMAAILGGCNNIKKSFQLNYYRYAIADPTKKKEGSKTEATWTWSSNCRKLFEETTKSGQIGADIDAYYANLPESTTLEDIIQAFARGDQYFVTRKNGQVVECLTRFAEMLDRGGNLA